MVPKDAGSQWLDIIALVKDSKVPLEFGLAKVKQLEYEMYQNLTY